MTLEKRQKDDGERSFREAYGKSLNRAWSPGAAVTPAAPPPPPQEPQRVPPDALY